MVRTLIDSERVLALAYSDAPYTPQQMITPAAIISAEQRFLAPVVGDAMVEAIAKERYITLFEDYVAPALALYVRYVVDGKGAPTAASVLGSARQMMRRLSDYLDENMALYPEYEPSENILKHCTIHGGFVALH